MAAHLARAGPGRECDAGGLSAATPLVWRERALLGLGTRLWLRAAHVDPRRVVIAEMDSGITIESTPDAGVVQWQNGSFPSFIQGFDSPHPLHTPHSTKGPCGLFVILK